ncbi:hypothetical protein KEM55_002044, partial [Ascosphaera atra]
CGRYVKSCNNCHDKKRGCSSIPLFLWEDEADIKSAKAELDKARGRDREEKAATVMKLANNIIEMIGARHSMLADAAAKGQTIDEDTELNKLLEERTAALGDKEEDTGDDENAADAASGKGETAKPPADAPASDPTTFEATAAPANAPANAAPAPVDAATATRSVTRKASLAKAPGGSVHSGIIIADDVFSPKQHAQQKAGKSPTKCKAALTYITTTPITACKRSHQDDTPQASPLDLFRRATNPQEMVLTASPPASNGLITVMEIVDGMGQVLHGLRDSVVELAEPSKRKEGFLAAILANMEEEKEYKAGKRHIEAWGKEEAAQEEQEEEGDEEAKRVRWDFEKDK